MECHARREARSHCPIHVQDKWCVHLLAVCDRCHTTCSFTVGKNRKNVQFLRDFYFAKTFLSDFFVWWFGHLSQENNLWSIIVSSCRVHCLTQRKKFKLIEFNLCNNHRNFSYSIRLWVFLSIFSLLYTTCTLRVTMTREECAHDQKIKL